MPNKLLSLHHICLSLGQRDILRDISLELHASSILTVIGPNGAGKSTLIRILLGLQQANSGTVWLRDKLRIGYVPQKLAINAQIPLSVRRFVSLVRAKSFKHDTLEHVMDSVGALHVLDQPVHSISGGELQRVLLARALLNEPELLVLDEPAQGVDINGQAEMYRLIDHLVKKRGFGVLMVSHDLHLVMAKANHVLCLNQHICCHGKPEAVSQHPEYLKLFGNISATRDIAIYTHDHDHQHGLDGNVCSLKNCERRKANG
jgi:zinc transport system ATP-binding protein